MEGGVHVERAEKKKERARRRAAAKKKREDKGREMRRRIAERPNCYLNQAATKTSQ